MSALLIQPGVSFALEEVLFGPEFTMMDIANGRIPPLKQVVMRMHQHLIGAQPEGAKFTFEMDPKDGDRGTFISPNGWWFHYHGEGSVLEIRMIPGTVDYYRHFERDMQDAIFVSGANEGVFPAMFQGGGHINLSSRSFLTNPLLLRNFIVDLFNHNELFMGIFGYDTNNALPLPMAEASTIEKVRKLIQAFDDGAYSSDPDPLKFAKDLSRILINASDDFWGPWQSWEGGSSRHKYYAVNFHNYNASTLGRIEIRGVRPQASMNMWNRQIGLLQRRLEYLERIREPIPLSFKVAMEPISFHAHRLNPPVKAEDAFRAFYEFVREAGELWADHHDYLWPKWVMDGELEKFEQSEWFLKREHNMKHILKLGKGQGVNARSCEGELAIAG